MAGVALIGMSWSEGSARGRGGKVAGAHLDKVGAEESAHRGALDEDQNHQGKWGRRREEELHPIRLNWNLTAMLAASGESGSSPARMSKRIGERRFLAMSHLFLEQIAKQKREADFQIRMAQMRVD